MMLKLKHLTSSANESRGQMVQFNLATKWARDKQKDRHKLITQKQTLWLQLRSLQVSAHIASMYGQLFCANLPLRRRLPTQHRLESRETQARLEQQALRSELKTIKEQYEAGRDSQYKLNEQLRAVLR